MSRSGSAPTFSWNIKATLPAAWLSHTQQKRIKVDNFVHTCVHPRHTRPSLFFFLGSVWIRLLPLTNIYVHSDWSDWEAHPVSAVCLFCDHQSETMDQIYTHMKVKYASKKYRDFIKEKKQCIPFFVSSFLNTIVIASLVLLSGYFCRTPMVLIFIT